MVRIVGLAVISFGAVACTQSVDETRDEQKDEKPVVSSSGNQPSNPTQQSQPPKKAACPEIDVPACASTDELVTGNDENGCSYAYCKPAACPPVATPQCDANSELVTGIDTDGCGYAYCKPAAEPAN